MTNTNWRDFFHTPVTPVSPVKAAFPNHKDQCRCHVCK